MIRIEQALSREIGLCAASIGGTAIAIAVKAHMHELRCTDFERYVSRVQHSTEELRALVELIVVSETWFFRDMDVFRTLLDHVHGAWLKSRTARALRVLSIPCATGEEPYSIAITLLDGGMTPDSFRIWAFDVSHQAVSAARLGLYGKNSFRGEPLGLRRRHFEDAGNGELRVGEAARACVTIDQGNLLEGKLKADQSQFDIIFCRNVLIYLDRNARVKACDNLSNWLAKDGILFTGHAEALDGMDPRFRRLEGGSHFAFARRLDPPALVAPVLVSPNPRLRKLTQARPVSLAAKRPSGSVVPQLASDRAKARDDSSAVDAGDTLVAVGRLADRGDLTAARRACERILVNSGASAEAYCLLGVVRKASGDADAALECFTKALYLDQGHYESLVHMALLLEQRGDRTSAANFRRRADRVGNGARK